MTINVTKAREITEKAIADTYAARLTCANNLIDNEIEPLITKAAGERLNECVISKKLFENYHEEVINNIINILMGAGFEVNESPLDIIITW